MNKEINLKLPQCKLCSNYIDNNILDCKIYKKNKKPDYIINCKKECIYFDSKESIKINPNSWLENRFFGGIFGFVVGDALGVPLEFKSREKIKEDPVKEMRAYGTHNQYFGTWSDDSSLMLCLLESLTNGYNLEKISENFVKFYNYGFLTPYGEVYDIGNTTVYAINKIAMGINPIECGGRNERDNGNGSLMRILPMAYFTKNFNCIRKIKMIEDVSSITHGHKRSKLACIIYNEMLINLLKEQSKEKSYEKTIDFVKNKCMIEYKDEINYFSRIINKNLLSLNEDDILSSGYVVDTLEAALWCFLTTDNYKDSILKAINLGDDTDTIAAITGGLSGVFYGIESIPDNWIQCIALKEEIYNLILKFYKTYIHS